MDYVERFVHRCLLVLNARRFHDGKGASSETRFTATKCAALRRKARIRHSDDKFLAFIVHTGCRMLVKVSNCVYIF